MSRCNATGCNTQERDATLNVKRWDMDVRGQHHVKHREQMCHWMWGCNGAEDKDNEVEDDEHAGQGGSRHECMRRTY